MNKKGEEETGRTGGVLTVILYLVVLVIVILGVYLIVTGKFIPFAKYLPSFNQTKPLVVDYEIFKYGIVNDKLQYYDGSAWIDFKQGTTIEANGKKIEANTLINDLAGNLIGKFKNFDGGVRAEIWPAIKTAIQAGLLDNALDYWGIYKFKSELEVAVPGGNVRLQVSGSDKHFYLQSGANDIYKLKNPSTWEDGLVKITDFSEIPEVLKDEAFINSIIAWRDSLINSPVSVHYSDGQTIETCFVKGYYTNDKSLVVDLSKPKDGGACPYLT